MMFVELGWVDNAANPRPICYTCFKNVYGGVDLDYFAGRGNCINWKHRDILQGLANKVIDSINERTDRHTLNQTMIDVGATASHTLFGELEAVTPPVLTIFVTDVHVSRRASGSCAIYGQCDIQPPETDEGQRRD
jgi:hypothetical protein